VNLDPPRFDPRIAALDQEVVFFPVRHHSPAAARLVGEAIERVRPHAVLIEGPSDFNEHWAELWRPHRLPIAIYSYVSWAGGARSGVFYPFCVYSPEWQAIQTARAREIHAEFIDLAWIDLSRHSKRSHAYADGEERRAGYVAALLERLGLEAFDDLWDQWFEIQADLSLEEYMARCHQLMFHVRASQEISEEDRRREAFMSARIAAALQAYGAPVLAVTGAYHCWALFSGASGPPVSRGESDDTAAGLEARGIALTPYSYERLDGLRGYEAGMPNPGFYHRVWTSRQTGKQEFFPVLLAEVVRAVRARKQQVSAADWIAAETLARGLAALRGQSEPWRRELVDGIRGAVIKDDVIRGFHPLLAAVHHVLRGEERGRLAEGTALPPLVEDIRRTVERHDLVLERTKRELHIDLTRAPDLAKAQVLHRLKGLDIAGYALVSGGQIARRDDVTQVMETWSLEWREEYDATCVERSVYGPSLGEASRAHLEESARNVESSAERAASILLEASLQGHFAIAGDFQRKLGQLIREDGDFHSVTAALNTLLYLFRYDDVLRAGNKETSGALLIEAYQRGLWLAEALMHTAAPTGAGLGIRLLKETVDRCGGQLNLARDEFVGVFERLGAGAASPYIRGASAGVLWSMAALPVDRISLPLSPTSEELGDFLAGLFALAREAVQRHPDLVARLDQLLMAFDDEAFLEGLPALRFAFSPFTPREKHHLVRTLLGEQGLGPKLAISTSDAARVMAWEGRVFLELERHGILPAESTT
jgi:hypothetical protein